MKTSLTLLTFAFATAFAAAAALSALGVFVPAWFDAMHLFTGYVAGAALMIALADYAPRRRLPLRVAGSIADAARTRPFAAAAHPLAA